MRITSTHAAVIGPDNTLVVFDMFGFVSRGGAKPTGDQPYILADTNTGIAEVSDELGAALVQAKAATRVEPQAAASEPEGDNSDAATPPPGEPPPPPALPPDDPNASLAKGKK